jgi:two-component system response regulator NreC
MFKIIIADDHKLVREGIKMLLASDHTISVVAEAEDGQTVIDLLRSGLETDIILSDITMPILDGMGLLNIVNVEFPHIKVIFLSMIEHLDHISDTLKAGASGYLLKSSNTDELTFAIRYVGNGNRYLSSVIALQMLEHYEKADIPVLTLPKHDFTALELDVLKHIAEGMTSQKIADILFMSKRTIEGYRQSLLDKTGATNTATLIRTAIEKRLI